MISPLHPQPARLHSAAPQRKTPRFASSGLTEIKPLINPQKDRLVLVNAAVLRVGAYTGDSGKKTRYFINVSLLPEIADKYGISRDHELTTPVSSLEHEITCYVQTGKTVPVVLTAYKKWFGRGTGYRVELDLARLVMKDVSKLSEEG